jgi:hypothetical protein
MQIVLKSSSKTDSINVIRELPEHRAMITTHPPMAVQGKVPALLAAFAKTHRLAKLQKDECQDWNINGKMGSITDYGDGVHLLATVLTEGGRLWSDTLRAARAVNCRVSQNGDTDGSFLILPDDPNQVQVALKGIRAIRRRKSPDSSRRLVA